MFKRLLINSTTLLLLSFSMNNWSVAIVIHEPASKTFTTADHNQKPVNKPNSLKGKKDNLRTNVGKFLVELTDIQKKAITSDLFRGNGNLKSSERTLADHSLEDLNIIVGSDEYSNQSLYKILDKTKTCAGSIVLAALLSNPVSDGSVIKRRQNLIRFLLENEALCNHLDTLLSTVKDAENSLLNYWNEDAELDENIKGLMYSPKNSRLSFLNKSSLYHQLIKITSFIVAGPLFITKPIMSVFFPISLLLSIGCLASGNIPEGISVGSSTISMGISIFVQKAVINYVRLIHRAVFSMHQRLRYISKVTESFDELFYEISNHNDLLQGLSLASNMSDFVVDPQSVSPDLPNLKDLLNRALFDKEKFGLFSHAGNVIAAHEYMYCAKDTFIAPLEAIGELDAYLAIVKVIKDHQAKSSGFCFVDFVEQKEPLIDLKGVWSMFIGPDKANPTNIVLGGSDMPNKVILSGASDSGKSIFAQTIASCDILGRTFGIAPAQKATMTFFDTDYTFIKVKQNSKFGSSLSQEERRRGTELVNYIKNNPTKKILAIIDEPYNSMIDESAEILAHDLGAEIAKYPNVACILATRHKKPTNLAEETGKFANYHFEITEDLPNDFNRTFKLLPGIDDWWFSDSAKKNRYSKFCD